MELYGTLMWFLLVPIVHLDLTGTWCYFAT